jgi:mannose-6-phosphate isomerase-like protein (cupin superfamily)
MPPRFGAEVTKQPQPELQIRADRHAHNEKLAQVMALAAKAGLTRIGNQPFAPERNQPTLRPLTFQISVLIALFVSPRCGTYCGAKAFIWSIWTPIMWNVFRISELTAKVAGTEPSFFEFVRSPQLSCAVYRLPVGAKDMQAPHLEDEVYVVVEGKAKVQIQGHEQEVGPGCILYIKATAEHSFFDITEDLTLLAMFGAAGH